MSASRFSRQTMLVEVGPRGQERIASAPLLVPEPASDELKRLTRIFGAAAGLGGGDASESLGSVQVESFFRHAPSRLVGTAAAYALLSVNRALASSRTK